MPRKGSTAEVAEGYDPISATCVLFNRNGIRLQSEEDFLMHPQKAKKTVSKLKLTGPHYKLDLDFSMTDERLSDGKGKELAENLKTFLGLSKDAGGIKPGVLKIDEEDFYKNKKLVIGFGEAGKEEPIGPVVFASVLLPEDKIRLFKDVNDVRSMSLDELDRYVKILNDHKIRHEQCHGHSAGDE